MPTSEVHNVDCMVYMAEIPDKFFDLAVVDPPYGGAVLENGESSRFHGRSRSKKYAQVIKVHRSSYPGGNHRRYNLGSNINHWDVAPSEEYFEELFRVSKNQIIWGGNYFDLPSTRCFLVWRKLSIGDTFTMAMVEYAWTSFNRNALCYEKAPQDKDRFHPTQKPVELYAWVLRHFAKPGDRILDTHLGSGSSRVAAYKMGYDFYACEIDDCYFHRQEKRFMEECCGEVVDAGGTVYKQAKLFQQ